MRYHEFCEGVVLANKARVDTLRTIISEAGGNRRFRVGQTSKKDEYQKLTLFNTNLNNSTKYSMFKEELHKQFGDLIKIEDQIGDRISLFFKYQ